MAIRFLILLAVFLAGAEARRSISNDESRDGQWRQILTEKLYRRSLAGLQSLLSVPQLPERLLTGRERFAPNLKSADRVLKFAWSNCGAASDPVQFFSLSVLPDPLEIPGDLTLSFNITSQDDVASPFPVDVDIKKKVAFWWVSVPCVDSFGSCSYGDLCPILPATCPASFIKANIPCHCPAQKGNYVMNAGVVPIPTLPIPEWLTSGDYKVTLNGKTPDGSRLFCLALQLTLA